MGPGGWGLIHDGLKDAARLWLLPCGVGGGRGGRLFLGDGLLDAIVAEAVQDKAARPFMLIELSGSIASIRRSCRHPPKPSTVQMRDIDLVMIS